MGGGEEEQGEEEEEELTHRFGGGCFIYKGCRWVGGGVGGGGLGYRELIGIRVI